MRHHPSLQEVLETKPLDEWLELPISSLSFKDFADSENSLGSISSPDLSLSCDRPKSEYGTYNFESVSVAIVQSSEKAIQQLQGKHPLGGINYYNEQHPGVWICLSKKTLKQILILISGSIKGLKFRVAIPKWDDKEIKCLPLLRYQFFYDKEI